jgi:hypothetical protein
MAAPAPPMNAATAPAPPVQAAAAGDAFRVAPTAKLAAERAEAGPAVDTRAPARAPLPVDEWIALIRKLRAEGKQDEASRELVAFRAAHADHERLLPSDLRDWRPSGK